MTDTFWLNPERDIARVSRRPGLLVPCGIVALTVQRSDLSLLRPVAPAGRELITLLGEESKIEETFRFVKQSYNLEDIRVMKYQRLKNLVLLVTVAAYFAATFLGQQMKLRILCEKLLIISQRFFGIPPFRFYALADGIRHILSQATLNPPEAPPDSLQLELTLGWEG